MARGRRRVALRHREVTQDEQMACVHRRVAEGGDELGEFLQMPARRVKLPEMPFDVQQVAKPVGQAQILAPVPRANATVSACKRRACG